jgi:hypothetical protein
MEEAVLINGVPHCKCGQILGLTKDHDLVVVNGETYVQFVKFCTGRGCMYLSHYETLHTVEDRQVFVFDKKDIKKVTSEDNKTKINNKEEID